MNLAYRRRLSRNYSINATYVLSRALAYNGNAAAFGNGPTDINEWFAPHDLGPTPADERHRITVSGLINLKWGITVTPIMQWATGRPYGATEGITDVFGYGSGENAEQRWPEPSPGEAATDFPNPRNPVDGSELPVSGQSQHRIALSTHAVLYALDGQTGKELWSSGDQIASWNHFSGLSVANGRVYIGTYDGMVYCFGLNKQGVQ